MDYYYSVDQERELEIKIKRSRFIAHLAYCESMQEAKDYIQLINQRHKTANHNCWAYVVGKKAENEHCSDAGEPSGSAGRPMLNALKKHKMTNIVAVVTRYFGGVKLGIRGLIDAYGQAVDSAAEMAPLIKLVETVRYKITCAYDFAEILKYRLGELGAQITGTEYTQQVALQVEIEKKDAAILLAYIDELHNTGKIEYYLEK